MALSRGRLALLGALLMGGTLLSGGCVDGGAPPVAALAAENVGESVELLIDYGDGAHKRFTNLAWQSGLTVLDVLNAAQKHPRGIVFTQRSSGAMALVTSIDGLENEGGGAEAKNWTFSVNGAFADKGAGAYALKAGEVVQWKYGASDQE